MIIDFKSKDARATLDDGTKLHWVKPDRGNSHRFIKPRVYLGAADWSVLEDLANRTRRPYEAWRPIAVAVLEKLGLTDVKLRWSQNAGCACGCSPGFIVTDDMNTLPYAMYNGDLFIELPAGTPTVDETKDPRLIFTDTHIDDEDQDPGYLEPTTYINPDGSGYQL